MTEPDGLVEKLIDTLIQAENSCEADCIDGAADRIREACVHARKLADALSAAQRSDQVARGTYNCPVCGWNEPHAEHAGDLAHRLLNENQCLREAFGALSDTKREIEVHIDAGYSVVSSNRVIDISTLKTWAHRLSLREHFTSRKLAALLSERSPQQEET